MESDWFPLIQADIFVSHSHADEEKAICLAGYLNETFGLKSFVDSCVWGNAGVLLKSIDNAKCLNPKTGNYDYTKRNYSTSHVHMMLSAALLKMIDKTECLFFLRTENSITATTDKIISETESPWLYAEILISSLIRKRTLAEHRPELTKARTYSDNSNINESKLIVKHHVYTGHLTDLDNLDLKLWELRYGHSLHGKYPLDGLYE